MMYEELVKQLNKLQAQVDGLIKPEVPLGISLIAESILTGSVASVAFSNIPQTFRHLMIMASARTDAAVEIDNLALRFNADAGNNYDWEIIYGNAATPTSQASRATSVINVGNTEGNNSRASTFAPTFGLIFNYIQTSMEKRTLSLNSVFGNMSADADLYAVLRVGHWRNTAAITSITLLPVTGPNFVTSSRFNLYGIY